MNWNKKEIKTEKQYTAWFPRLVFFKFHVYCSMAMPSVNLFLQEIVTLVLPVALLLNNHSPGQGFFSVL